ncbi:unnamed protein product [Rhizophagus irregularis]|nr:unnamed protein product [Rhizophagus irregularis]
MPFLLILTKTKQLASKWIANIEQVTLKDLKEFIFALYQSPELQKDVVTLVFSCNDEKYSPKDFALIQIQNSRIIGITEVKDKDFQQGVAQNTDQCESALSNKKKNVFEEAQRLDELEDKK